MTRPTVVRLDEVQADGNGVAWSTSPEGLHVNLVALEPGGEIGEHRNDALDVVVIAINGDLVASVDGTEVTVPPNAAVVVPRGARRRLTAGAGGARYLTVHAGRPAMQIGRRRDG